MHLAEQEEFAEFVRAQHASLFRTAYLMTGDYQRAEDIVQTALVKVFLRWRQIQSMSQPGAYAKRIVANQTLSWWRRRSSTESVVDTLGDRGVPGHEERVTEHDTMWRAVLQLPPRQRAVIVLRYYEDLSEAETAEVLDMAVGTVKSHSNAAHHRLATLLDDPAPGMAHTEKRPT
ncbi:RNA polymerase sigma-70 factor (sigma-E family) [Nocardioides ginsengisegetis]|uniref:RNA polymerase sigma-70 factor (Sigma-E family) n=1 Tax=Nocardioides ginsengisegetis TaxID=661491 RepID=A0A7W3P7U2_9ACTN|nr:SigE family RNA polymerase sigma factor [Nocardioides ginsengisegetis]MBA8801777.1 RNA polymerase sigma-70 factor (sigma-E family) [Nocardioides ginsengisegetis]